MLTGQGHKERPQIAQAMQTNDPLAPATVVTLINNLNELGGASPLLNEAANRTTIICIRCCDPGWWHGGPEPGQPTDREGHNQQHCHCR